MPPESVYEAGFRGLWAHHRMCNLGVNSIVANIADIPGTHKTKSKRKIKKQVGRLTITGFSYNSGPVYVISFPACSRDFVHSCYLPVPGWFQYW
jgi:hypothetical protein